MSTTNDDRLRAILDSIDHDETVALARALVQIPSISGQEGMAISEFMARWLNDAGVDSSLQQVDEGRANVYGRVSGSRSGPRLLLNGHLDTKPVEGMTIDPFAGEIRDGRLYGRGSCDMKGPVAAEMIAMKAIARGGIDLHGTLIFGSEVGEDGGTWRIDELLDGPGACDIGICGEPTKLEIHLGCRGTFPLRIRTIGRATHTGTAYTGVNAIQKMCAIIPALYDLPCFHRVDPIWGRSPINAMIISGGGKVSASVPDECVCRFDIRLNPDLTPEALDAELEETFTRLRAADSELKFEVEKTIQTGDRTYNSRSASSIPADDRLVGAVGDVVERILGQRPRLAGFPGGCSVWPMSDRGVRSLIFGPGNLEQAHTVDEWIDVEEIYQAAKVYAALAFDLLAA